MKESKPLEDQRFRKFSCVTYLSEIQLHECLQRAGDMIRGFAYCYHDKDVNDDGTLKEPHTHLLLWLYQPRSVNSLRGWFDRGFRDEKGEKVNTLLRPCRDIKAAAGYLIHLNDPDKYQYPPESVVYSDPELFINSDIQQEDKSLLALEDLLNGVSPLEVARRYGRDFLYHWGHIRQFLYDIGYFDSIRKAGSNHDTTSCN